MPDVPGPGPPLGQEEYLGDGLFASFDGYHICLRAPREDGDHLVFLEPMVLAAFIKYAEKIRRKRD